MARVILSSPFSSFVGSIGAMTFSISRSGLIARTKNYQRKGNFMSPTNQKQVIQYFTRKWKELDPSLQRDWVNLAATFLQPQKHNPHLYLTGYELFLQSHLSSYKVLQSWATLPAMIAAHNDFTPSPSSFDLTSETFSVSVTPTSDDGEHYYTIAASPAFSGSALANRHRFKFISSKSIAGSDSIDCYGDFLRTFPQPQRGQSIQLLIQMYSHDSFLLLASHYLTTTVV